MNNKRILVVDDDGVTRELLREVLEKDGFEVLKELKKNEHFKKIPVIVASNLGQREDIDVSMQLGASDYFVKANTSLSDVIGKINALLELPAQQVRGENVR